MTSYDSAGGGGTRIVIGIFLILLVLLFLCSLRIRTYLVAK